MIPNPQQTGIPCLRLASRRAGCDESNQGLLSVAAARWQGLGFRWGIEKRGLQVMWKTGEPLYLHGGEKGFGSARSSWKTIMRLRRERRRHEEIARANQADNEEHEACVLSSELVHDKTARASRLLLLPSAAGWAWFLHTGIPAHLHDARHPPAAAWRRLQPTGRKHSVRSPAEQRLQPASAADWSAWT